MSRRIDVKKLHGAIEELKETLRKETLPAVEVNNSLKEIADSYGINLATLI